MQLIAASLLPSDTAHNYSPVGTMIELARLHNQLSSGGENKATAY